MLLSSPKDLLRVPSEILSRYPQDPPQISSTSPQTRPPSRSPQYPLKIPPRSSKIRETLRHLRAAPGIHNLLHFGASVARRFLQAPGAPPSPGRPGEKKIDKGRALGGRSDPVPLRTPPPRLSFKHSGGGGLGAGWGGGRGGGNIWVVSKRSCDLLISLTTYVGVQICCNNTFFVLPKRGPRAGQEAVLGAEFVFIFLMHI